MKVIFLGPPGSGKGTQAKILSDRLGISHFSTGDMFRKLQADGDPTISRLQKEYSERGKLIPDSEVMPLVFRRLSEPDCYNGYILDGIPRTIGQAKILDNSEFAVDSVINFLIPYMDVVKRLSGRRNCPSCHKIYNLASLVQESAPNGEYCSGDKCCTKLAQREDDKPEIILKRLKVYSEETEPLIDYYSARGMLKSCKADRTPEAISNDLLGLLSHSQLPSQY